MATNVNAYGFDGVNKDLLDTAELIEKKTYELEDAREKYLMAKAAYENYYSRSLLETRLKNPEIRIGELSAQAKMLAYDKQLESIRAESRYKKLANEIKALRDKLTAVQEISYNLRRERTQI